MRRVVITGMGSLNALGVGVDAFTDGLRTGRCAIGELSLFPSEGFRCTLAAEVKEIPVPDWVARRSARRSSRSTLLALVAADEAWRGAGLVPGEGRDPRCGIVFGTTTGGMASGEDAFRGVIEQDRRLDRTSRWLETPVSVPVDILAAAFCPGGPRLTISTACSSGAHAIGVAAAWIRSGRAETVLCGATDSLCRMTFSGFNALQALDRRPCRPFDRDRAGLSLGEGAAAFVLEDRKRAVERGAAILGEVVGYGASADAYHLTQPRPDGRGAVMAMRRALTEAGVAAAEIDYINAHGTGTPLNDVAETRAIKEVLGDAAPATPVSSTKSMIGHCLGSAGALEALASLLALRAGFVPPTVNLETPDPECDLDCVPGKSRPAALRTVLSNSYGFGGNNTSIILRSGDV